MAGNYAQCTQPATACGDGAIATSAQFNSPAGLFVDGAEDIFIADTFDNRIREVTASNTIINTVAGTGARGYAGDGAAATSALLDTPYGLFVDTLGDIFIADTDNAAIREVVAATGFIQTVAGIPPNVNGLGSPGFSGDGTCQSISAQFNSPSGLFSDSAGDLFVADTDNARIRKLVPSHLRRGHPESSQRGSRCSAAIHGHGNRGQQYLRHLGSEWSGRRQRDRRHHLDHRAISSASHHPRATHSDNNRSFKC